MVAVFCMVKVVIKDCKSFRRSRTEMLDFFSVGVVRAQLRCWRRFTGSNVNSVFNFICWQSFMTAIVLVCHNLWQHCWRNALTCCHTLEWTPQSQRLQAFCFEKKRGRKKKNIFPFLLCEVQKYQVFMDRYSLFLGKLPDSTILREHQTNI